MILYKNSFLGLLLLLLSTSLLLSFAVSTSPICVEPFVSDSGIFQLVGKGWTEGLLPYAGLWDNKGPLLYLINALGFLLTGNRMGVFFLQIINLSCALWIIYRTFCLRVSSRAAWFFIMLALLWLPNTMLNNDPGEWLLVPLSLSFYLLIRWLDAFEQREARPADRDAVVYGVTIGCALMLRVSDCFSLLLALMATYVIVLRTGQWQWVLRQVGIAGVAFIVVLSPFMLYFYTHQCLGEMWYALFLHNLEYVSQSRFQSYSMYAIVSFCLSFLSYVGTFIVYLAISFSKSKYRRDTLVWFFASAGMLLFFFNTYASGRYGTSSLPFFAIMLLGIERLMEDRTRWMSHSVRAVLSIALVCVFVFQLWQVWTRDRMPNPDLPVYRAVENIVPQRERCSFIAFNTWPDVYYYTSLKPCHRFFITISTYVQGTNDTLREKIRDEYAKGKANWVLVRESGYENYLQDILNDHYQVHYVLPHGYLLYNKK